MFLRAVESRISSAVEHFTRNEGVPSSNLGFGSKVRGHRPETQRKTAAKQFAGGFLLRNVTRESEADFRKRPCGKQPREDERSDVKFGFGSKVRGRKARNANGNRRKVICWRFFVAERDSRKRGGLSKAPLRQAAERRRAQRCQIRIRLESPRPQTRDAKKNRRKAICRRFSRGGNRTPAGQGKS